MGGRAVSFTIPGRVGGKGRPRFTVIGGHARAYTPAKTRATEARIREIASDTMGDVPKLEGPLSLHVTVVLTPPPSWSKKKREAAHWVTGKPDADNTLKMFDAFNGVVWTDDAQVAVVSFKRVYRLDEEERVLVVVGELEGDEIARAA